MRNYEEPAGIALLIIIGLVAAVGFVLVGATFAYVKGLI